VFPGGNPPSLLQGFVGADDQNAPRWLIDHTVEQIALMREAAGPKMEIALDLNYHFKTEGAVRIARALEPYDLMWIEHDSESPEALAQLRESVRVPICSGEQLQAPRQYLPFFERRAMDVVMIDVPWQGFSAAKKVADLAELHELNIAPHNFNSHLATAISLNLCAAVSNVKILEHDVDSIPWRDAFTTFAPRIENGMMDVPTGPGWGCDVVEEALVEYRADLEDWGPWKL
jgi:L-alanine-DL-glutamate epimerase-like enolase superfamily enzyme